jgi:hypothetical protein
LQRGQPLGQHGVKLDERALELVFQEHATECLVVHLCQERGEQFGRWVAVDGVHVDRDSRGPLVIAGVNEQRGNLDKTGLSAGDHAMITAEDLIRLALSAHDDGRQEAVALDGALERLALLIRQILRVAPQRYKIGQFGEDLSYFRRHNANYSAKWNT